MRELAAACSRAQASRNLTLVSVVLVAVLAAAIMSGVAPAPGSTPSPSRVVGPGAVSPVAPALATGTAVPADPTSRSPFLTLPPGSTLRSDAACARAVSPAAETNPKNSPYNNVTGAIRLPADFFPLGSGDSRANKRIATRVTGAFTGTTPQILQWVACKWGVSEKLVAAQATAESSWEQRMLGDWSRNADHCAPQHGLGVDGRPHRCPESFGMMQVRYRFFSGAFPDAINSTAFNVDAAYAVWRACYEGYEWWLQDVAAPGRSYAAGDKWGCIGRWYSGRWYGPLAEQYIRNVQCLVRRKEPCW